MIHKYDKEYRILAVKLAKENGIKTAARILDMPSSTLSSWIKKRKNFRRRKNKD